MDRYQQLRFAYGDASVQGVIGAGTTGPITLIALKTGYSIFVQRIHYLPTTSAAQVLTFEDTAGTPVIVGVIPASPTVDQEITFDWGPVGYQLTESQALQLAIAAAGQAGTYRVEAYQKAIGVANVLIGNQVGGGTPGTAGSKDP